MNQLIWGPHLWFSLHTISFTYPLNPSNTDKQTYKEFFINFKNVIPCNVCKKNYKRHLYEKPIDNYLNTRKELVYWLIDLHNLVNGETGKRLLSYNEVIKQYENVYNKPIELEQIIKVSQYNQNYIYLCVMLVVIILFLLVIYLKRPKLLKK